MIDNKLKRQKDNLTVSKNDISLFFLTDICMQVYQLRKLINDTVIAFYSKNVPKFTRGKLDDAMDGRDKPIRDITSDKGPMSRNNTTVKSLNQTQTTMFSKGSGKAKGSNQTSATRQKEKDLTVAEVDAKKDDFIDYKNEAFNEVVYEIFLAREKVKGKIVEIPSPEISSKKKRRTLKAQ